MRKFRIVDNPGEGACGYFAMVIALIDILKSEIAAGHTPRLDRILAETREANRNILTNYISQLNIPSGSTTKIPNSNSLTELQRCLRSIIVKDQLRYQQPYEISRQDIEPEAHFWRLVHATKDNSPEALNTVAAHYHDLLISGHLRDRLSITHLPAENQWSIVYQPNDRQLVNIRRKPGNLWTIAIVERNDIFAGVDLTSVTGHLKGNKFTVIPGATFDSAIADGEEEKILRQKQIDSLTDTPKALIAALAPYFSDQEMLPEDLPKKMKTEILIITENLPDERFRKSDTHSDLLGVTYKELGGAYFSTIAADNDFLAHPTFMQHLRRKIEPLRDELKQLEINKNTAFSAIDTASENGAFINGELAEAKKITEATHHKTEQAILRAFLFEHLSEHVPTVIEKKLEYTEWAPIEDLSRLCEILLLDATFYKDGTQEYRGQDTGYPKVYFNNVDGAHWVTLLTADNHEAKPKSTHNSGLWVAPRKKTSSPPEATRHKLLEEPAIAAAAAAPAPSD